MAIHAPVPSETEPTSIVDLASDCAEVAGVLGHSVLDLTVGITRSVTRGPLQQVPLARLPISFGAMPVEITEDLLVTVDGLEDY